MRYLAILFCILLFFVTSVWSQQQTYLMGGASFPSSKQMNSDYWKEGYNVGGGFGWSIFSGLSITTLIEFHSFSFDKPRVANVFGLRDSSGVDVQGDGVTLYTISANGKYSIIPIDASTIISPYVTAGIGYMLVYTTDARIVRGYSSYSIKGSNKSALSVLLGAGVDVPLSSTFGVFVEGKYVQGFIKNHSTSYVPVEAGIRISR
jgi:opacity protein-like surface antigen